MTLILTALCKNGISICADKRSRRQYDNGKVEIKDDLNKIYKLDNSRIVICNHGVNEIQGKSWIIFCSEYEQTDRWKGKRLKDVALDFKEFIEADLLRQLDQNARNFPGNANVTTSAFVICGKDLHSGKFEFYELFWSPDYSFGSWNDTRLIGSGEGYKKHLENYLNQHPQTNSTEFWGTVNTVQAETELRRLFSIALKEQKSANGDDFSENFDIESISD